MMIFLFLLFVSILPVLPSNNLPFSFSVYDLSQVYSCNNYPYQVELDIAKLCADNLCHIQWIAETIFLRSRA